MVSESAKEAVTLIGTMIITKEQHHSASIAAGLSSRLSAYRPGCHLISLDVAGSPRAQVLQSSSEMTE